ncbi:MAG: GFA family protein, partial [Pseudomonadota bacterium]
PDTQFVGGDAIRVFNSSEWAERGFCSICGTHLFYRLKATGQHFIPVGLFDDTDGLEFAQEVFVDEQPHYYRFANDTKRLTGAELFALISGEET